jgi:hypothetical protein
VATSQQKIKPKPIMIEHGIDNIFEHLEHLLSYPPRLLDPLQFTKLKRPKPKTVARILAFGQTGHGKSTTGNYLLRESIIDKNGIEIPRNGYFKVNQNPSKPVKRDYGTPNCQCALEESDSVCYIETCGFDQSRSSYFEKNTDDIVMMDIFSTAYELLKYEDIDKLEDSYINEIFFIFMAERGGTIAKSAMTILYNVLLGFTITYPHNFIDVQKKNKSLNPGVKILITNFSKSCQEPRANKKSSMGDKERWKTQSNMQAEDYRRSMREMLADKIIEIQRLTKEEAKFIVGQILPDQNFYFFNTDVPKNKRDEEMFEIRHMINDIRNSDCWTLEADFLANLKPVIRDIDTVDLVIKLFKNRLNLSAKLISHQDPKAKNDLLLQKLKEIQEIFFLTDKEKAEILEKIYDITKPCLQKEATQIKGTESLQPVLPSARSPSSPKHSQIFAGLISPTNLKVGPTTRFAGPKSTGSGPNLSPKDTPRGIIKKPTVK